jgi:hypothetical protein
MGVLIVLKVGTDCALKLRNDREARPRRAIKGEVGVYRRKGQHVRKDRNEVVCQCGKLRMSGLRSG